MIETEDHLTGERFYVGPCKVCSLGVTIPTPTTDELGKYYPVEYFGNASSSRARQPFAFLQEILTKRLARKLVRRSGTKGRALDVGCGRGLLLHEIRQLGWEVVGTEMSEHAAAFARRTLDLPVQIGTLGSLNYPDEAFDLIILSHVLEHVHDPMSLLEEIARVLQPGGMVVVAVPNWKSIEAQITGGGWFGWEAPRHLIHFDPVTLDRCLRAAGLQPTQIEHLWWWQVFMFVQSILNRIGFPRNHFHDMLRSGSARRSRDLRFGAAIGFAEFVLALPLGIIAIPAVLLFAALKRGATLTAFARKSG